MAGQHPGTARVSLEATGVCSLDLALARSTGQPWLMRHLHSLGVEHTRSGNRLHAASRSTATARCVLTDLKRSMAALAKRIATLRRQARLLVGMPGIAELSALQMLAELAPLAEAMSVRQWVAHSGLDPAHQVSGTSVHKPSRISRAGNRHLRRALFMPALIAARRDPHLKAFYQGLLERQDAGHPRRRSQDAPRHLRHLPQPRPYDGSKLFPAITPA